MGLCYAIAQHLHLHVSFLVLRCRLIIGAMKRILLVVLVERLVQSKVLHYLLQLFWSRSTMHDKHPKQEGCSAQATGSCHAGNRILVQDAGDMQILALLQQAQVQRAAEEALTSLDQRAMQAEVASEQQQQQALQVCPCQCPSLLTFAGGL